MKNIRKVYIDGRTIKTELDFHQFFVHHFDDFGDFYGYNLDAFWDIISCGGLANVHLYWQYHEISKQNLNITFHSIIFFLNLLKTEIQNNQYDDCFDYFLM